MSKIPVFMAWSGWIVQVPTGQGDGEVPELILHDLQVFPSDEGEVRCTASAASCETDERLAGSAPADGESPASRSR